jgi:acetolactate synthase-1/2/3 large subunit
MIKLSDYVINFIEQKGIRHVFVLPGGGCMHLVNSLGNSRSIEHVCCLHEQALSIAAEAYGQHTNEPGVGLVTTGPGGTNAVTGVTAAWIDSTPCLIISGQVKRADLIGDRGVRQMGPQEVDIVSIVKPVTKYAVTVMDPEEIRYHLEKAYFLAMNGRKGPVWIDIPLDVQAAMIEESELRGFCTDDINTSEKIDQGKVKLVLSYINQAERPVILAGNGIKLAGAEDLFLALVEKLRIPVLLTWKVIDMMDDDFPFYFGRPGILGQRGANFILQNSDLLIVIGSRLDSSITAYDHMNFAPKAKKIMVDIDRHEIEKMKMDIDIPITADAKEFLLSIEHEIEYIESNDRNEWLDYCICVKDKYPVVMPEYYEENGYVNTYAFTDVLSKIADKNDIIVPESSGSAGEVTYQAFKVKSGQKIRNAAGLGAMGFGLPYAIGACLANNRKRTILINGDGAFQLNIQELETVVRLDLPVKIFIWNNNGYASIMATQRNYFNGNYVASNREGGLTLPKILNIAEAYGIKTYQLKSNNDLEETINNVLKENGPVLCEVIVSPMQAIAPKAQSIKLPDGKMISKPLDDMWPYLYEQELKANNIF